MTSFTEGKVPTRSSFAETRQVQPLLLQGPPYERGLTHGRVLRSSIQAVVGVWQDSLHNSFGMDGGEVIARFVERTDYVSAIQRWTPELLDEIQGIADGAGVGFRTMLAFQLVDELWNQGEAVYGEHCSSIGLFPHGQEPTCLAQTIDLETFRDGFQVLLHIKHHDSDLESFVVSCAGLVGFNGLNNKAIGVCCNTLMQVASCCDGLPVACVVRGVLQQRTEQEAFAFLQGVHHASGQNYIVGGPQGVYDLECSANQVIAFTPQRGSEVVWHTNHPLANTDYKPWFREALEKGESYPFLENSQVRCQTLERRLGDPPPGRRLDGIKEILSSKDSAEHPVCGSQGKDEFYTSVGMFTFASTIMVLSQVPELHVTLGPPDRAPYDKLMFGA